MTRDLLVVNYVHVLKWDDAYHGLYTLTILPYTLQGPGNYYNVPITDQDNIQRTVS